MAIFARTRLIRFPASPRFYIVGDSRTSGHAEGNGAWRAPTYQALAAAGYSPDFRGSIVNTTDTPPLASTAIAGVSHSGLDGASGHNWYASYWDSFNFATSFPTPADYPQIICLDVGSNDVDSAAAATDFCRLIDKALTSVPTARVLMATTARAQAAGSYATQAAQVRIEVATRRAAGVNVALVDAHAVVLGGGDWIDGLHLTTQGYRKVAERAWIPAMFSLMEGSP